MRVKKRRIVGADDEAAIFEDLCGVLNYRSGNSVRIEYAKYAEICNLMKVESGVASLCHRCNLGFAGASASCRSVVSFEQHRKLIAFSTLIRFN